MNPSTSTLAILLALGTALQPSRVVAQPPAVDPGTAGVDEVAPPVPDEAGPTEPTGPDEGVGVAASEMAAPPPVTAPPPQARDAEVAGPSRVAQVEEHAPEPPVGQGNRLFLSVQANSSVGELLEDPTAGFDFQRATLVGVPDALVGLRFDIWTVGVGFTWNRINTPTVMTNPCSGDNEEYDDARTLWGLLPTFRGDVLTTADGRGRIDLGLTLPILLASRAREQAVFDCTGDTPGVRTDDATDGIYGFNLHAGGRYHLWPALAVGLELGLSYLIFDADDDPDTDYDEPSTTSLTVYSALTFSIEAPL